MRRFSRQIEVFDISLMAVVTKAMGAFLVLFVVVLPFYTGDPDVASSARAAREQIAQLKRELEAFAGRIGADPKEEQALGDAIRRMQAMVAEGDARIAQLTEKADALSSQLRRSQAELDKARTDAEAAKASLNEARFDAAELERLANQYDRDRRAAMAANAEGEAMETQYLHALGASAYAARVLVFDSWSWKPDCPTGGISVFAIDGGKVPESVDPSFYNQDISVKMLSRTSDADLAIPAGEAKAGEPRRAVRTSPLFEGDAERGVVVAYMAHPSAAPCHLELSTTSVDVVTRAAKMLDQKNVELPASAGFVLLAGFDYANASVRLSPPNDDDRSFWAGRKESISKVCAQMPRWC